MRIEKLSHGESREELEILINDYITRLNNGVSVKNIYDEIGDEYNKQVIIYLSCMETLNKSIGKKIRALAYAYIETEHEGLTNMPYLDAEIIDIREIKRLAKRKK